MNIYGYCRISTAKQSIDRQIRNIKAEYPTAHIVQETIDNLSYFFSEGALDVLRLGGSDGLDGGVGISASDLDSSALVDVGFEDSSFGGCEIGVPHSGQKMPSLTSVPHLGHFIMDSPFYFL